MVAARGKPAAAAGERPEADRGSRGRDGRSPGDRRRGRRHDRRRRRAVRIRVPGLGRARRTIRHADRAERRHGRPAGSPRRRPTDPNRPPRSPPGRLRSPAEPLPAPDRSRSEARSARGHVRDHGLGRDDDVLGDHRPRRHRRRNHHRNHLAEHPHRVRCRHASIHEDSSSNPNQGKTREVTENCRKPRAEGRSNGRSFPNQKNTETAMSHHWRAENREVVARERRCKPTAEFNGNRIRHPPEGGASTRLAGVGVGLGDAPTVGIMHPGAPNASRTPEQTSETCTSATSRGVRLDRT